MGIKEMMQEAAVIIYNGDSLRVMYCDEDEFVACQEDGIQEEYRIPYTDVDLDRDLLYKFTLMNPTKETV
jgi:hypothetical protein